MAQSILQNSQRYEINSTGTYTFDKVVCAGYNTASGNYVDFTLPISINPTLNNISIALRAGSFVYTDNVSIDIKNTTVDNVYRVGDHITIDVKYPTTKTANVPVVGLLFITLTIS